MAAALALSHLEAAVASAPSSSNAGNHLTRLNSGDARTALEQFANAELIAAGKVNVIALDQLAERFGGRWRARQEQVHEHVLSVLDARLGNQGYYLRVSDTDILVCHPEIGQAAGQAACLRYLREILTHFLGDGEAHDCQVHQVLSIASGCIEARRLDSREVAAASTAPNDPAEAPAPSRTLLGAASEPTTPAVDRWAPFVAAGIGRVRVSCALEPVIELKAYGRIGFRLTRRIMAADTDLPLTPRDLARLSGRDLLRIDLTTIARGLHRLSADHSQDRHPSLVVPVSIISVSSVEGRVQIINALKAANGFVRRGLICELCDVEDVPPSTLLSAAAVVRPFSLFLIARLTGEAPPDTSTLRACGIQGLSLECPGNLDERGLVGWAQPRVSRAKRVARSVLVYRAGSSRRVAMAAELGATHAGLNA